MIRSMQDATVIVNSRASPNFKNHEFDDPDIAPDLRQCVGGEQLDHRWLSNPIDNYAGRPFVCDLGSGCGLLGRQVSFAPSPQVCNRCGLTI